MRWTVELTERLIELRKVERLPIHIIAKRMGIRKMQAQDRWTRVKGNPLWRQQFMTFGEALKYQHKMANVRNPLAVGA